MPSGAVWCHGQSRPLEPFASGLFVPKKPAAMFQSRLVAGCDGVETMLKSSMTS